MSGCVNSPNMLGNKGIQERGQTNAHSAIVFLVTRFSEHFSR